MSGQVPVVLDTNFVFAKANQMEELLQKLRENHEVYITQISVDERKEQMCRDFEKGYVNVKRYFSDFAFVLGTLNVIEIDEALNKLRHGMQKKYELAFSEHIIPCNASKGLLKTIIERANRKIPPFSAEDKASDKGFKDTLIWLSVLDYFKTNGEDEVIFVSNDGGFKKDMDFLCREFKEFTGKTIAIKDNNFYLDVVEPQTQEPQQKSNDKIPLDGNVMRGRILSIIDDLCGFNNFDYWGNRERERTFTINKRIDSDYMRVIFNHLKQDITNNLFEISVPADKILELDDRVTNLAPIPMESLENALSLHEEIKAKHPDFLPQFYSAAANIVNSNYIEPQAGLPISGEDDELPF